MKKHRHRRRDRRAVLSALLGIIGILLIVFALLLGVFSTFRFLHELVAGL